MDARFVLEPVFGADFDLRRQSVPTCVDRGADDRGETRSDQGRPGDDGEDPRSFRVSSAWPPYAEEVASLQTSA
jgi:hypothetical protein